VRRGPLPRLRVRVRTGFGEIEVQGESPGEVLEGLGWLTPEFVAAVTGRVSEVAAAEAEDVLKGIVRVGRDGPTIVTREELSHYESIGLILYAMRDHEATGKAIRDRLASSGKSIRAAARLHEMRRRGHVFQPDGKGSEYRLTERGVKWVEEEVLPRLGEG
jgi:hypothetical protein